MVCPHELLTAAWKCIDEFRGMLEKEQSENLQLKSTNTLLIDAVRKLHDHHKSQLTLSTKTEAEVRIHSSTCDFLNSLIQAVGSQSV